MCWLLAAILNWAVSASAGVLVFGAILYARLLSIPLVVSYHTHIPHYIPQCAPALLPSAAAQYSTLPDCAHPPCTQSGSLTAVVAACCLLLAACCMLLDTCQEGRTTRRR